MCLCLFAGCLFILWPRVAPWWDPERCCVPWGTDSGRTHHLHASSHRHGSQRWPLRLYFSFLVFWIKCILIMSSPNSAECFPSFSPSSAASHDCAEYVIWWSFIPVSLTATLFVTCSLFVTGSLQTLRQEGSLYGNTKDTTAFTWSVTVSQHLRMCFWLLGLYRHIIDLFYCFCKNHICSNIFFDGQHGLTYLCHIITNPYLQMCLTEQVVLTSCNSTYWTQMCFYLLSVFVLSYFLFCVIWKCALTGRVGNLIKHTQSPQTKNPFLQDLDRLDVSI